MSSFFRTPRAEHPSGAQGFKTTGRTACALIIGGSLVLPLALPAQAVDAASVPEAIPAASASPAAVPTEAQTEASLLETQPVASYRGATAESGDAEPAISAVPTEAPVEPALPELPIETVTAETEAAPAVADPATEATPAAAEEKPKLIAPTHYKGEDLGEGMIRLEHGLIDMSQPTARITGWMRNGEGDFNAYSLFLRSAHPDKSEETTSSSAANFTYVEVADAYHGADDGTAGALYYFEMTVNTSYLEAHDYEVASASSPRSGYTVVGDAHLLHKINQNKNPYVLTSTQSLLTGNGGNDFTVYLNHFDLLKASSIKVDLVAYSWVPQPGIWNTESRVISSYTIQAKEGQEYFDSDHYNRTIAYSREDILYFGFYEVRATAYAADGAVLGIRTHSMKVDPSIPNVQTRIPAITQEGKATARIHVGNVNGYRTSSWFYITAHLTKKDSATGEEIYIYPTGNTNDGFGKPVFDGHDGADVLFTFEDNAITQDGYYTLDIEIGNGDSIYDPALFESSFNVENAISSTRPVDAQEDHAYHKELSWAVKQGYMGTVDGAVGPQWNVNRAEVIATLYRLYGSPRVYTSNPYQDIDWRYPHYQAILWATNMGLISPDEQGNFNPGEQVNRQFMLNLLYRLDAFPKEQNPSLQQQLEWAYDLNLVPAQLSAGGGTFGAHQPLSRAELAAFLYLWAPHIS